MIDLRLGDCLELMKTLPDGSVDAVITDPPYGTRTAEWDNEPDPRIWSELKRVCPEGPIAIFGYAKQLMRWSAYFTDLELIGYVVWNHYVNLIVSQGLTRAHQDIGIWGRSIKQVHADRVREPYSKNTKLDVWFDGQRFGGQRNDELRKVSAISERLRGAKKHPDGKRCTDLWRIAGNYHGFHSRNRFHPNQKPDEVMDRLVKLLSERTVLDPYMGSGTTGVACVKLNRNFIGMEINPQYYEIAQRRITGAQAQTTMAGM